MDSLGSEHKNSLSQQREQLGTEGLVLQRRLLENLAHARMYGDTMTSRVERARLLTALNHLALGTVGKPFSALFSAAEFEDFIRDSKGNVTFVGREPIIIGDSNLAKRILEATQEAGEKARDDLHQDIELYKQAIVVACERGNREAEAIHLQELGLTQVRLAAVERSQRQGHLSRAADAFRQAAELFDVVGAAPLLLARTRYHLGRCYHQLGRWREAIELLEQVRETFSRHKARPELAHTLLELGQLYRLTQDFESAYIYLKDALRLFRRMEDTDGIAVTQETLGSLAMQTARLSEAIESLKEARRGYEALRRSERVRAVDDLLRIASQTRQPVGGTT